MTKKPARACPRKVRADKSPAPFSGKKCYPEFGDDPGNRPLTGKAIGVGPAFYPVAPGRSISGIDLRSLLENLFFLPPKINDLQTFFTPFSSSFFIPHRLPTRLNPCGAHRPRNLKPIGVQFTTPRHAFLFPRCHSMMDSM